MAPPFDAAPLCPVCSSPPLMTAATHTRNVAIFICYECGSTLSMPTDRERSRVAESARLEAAGLIHAIIKDGHVDVPAAVRGVVEQALLNDLIVLAIVPPTKTT